jgi:hypothetical protein
MAHNLTLHACWTYFLTGDVGQFRRSARTHSFAAIRYFGIITCTAGGPRLRGREPSPQAARQGVADARGVWASGLMPITVRGRVAVATRTRTRLNWNNPFGLVRRRRAERDDLTCALTPGRTDTFANRHTRQAWPACRESAVTHATSSQAVGSARQPGSGPTFCSSHCCSGAAVSRKPATLSFASAVCSHGATGQCRQQIRPL